MAVVIPAPGALKETAQLLLSLAGSVQDVRTISNGTQFEVPDDLADAYNRAVSESSGAATTKRRGRPRAPRKE